MGTKVDGGRLSTGTNSTCGNRAACSHRSWLLEERDGLSIHGVLAETTLTGVGEKKRRKSGEGPLLGGNPRPVSTRVRETTEVSKKEPVKDLFSLRETFGSSGRMKKKLDGACLFQKVSERSCDGRGHLESRREGRGGCGSQMRRGFTDLKGELQVKRGASSDLIVHWVA